jgi:hypothetical protein
VYSVDCSAEHATKEQVDFREYLIVFSLEGVPTSKNLRA